MCRNYDGGECKEEGCTKRITCRDFDLDKKCEEHAINGRDNFWLEDADDETIALTLRPWES